MALGRLARTRLLIQNGQLIPLSQGRLKIDWGHYLVYPERSVDHAGLEAFRSWLHEQARDYVAAMDSDLAQRGAAQPAALAAAPAKAARKRR